MLFPAETNWRDRVGKSLLSLTVVLALAVVLVMSPLAQPLAYHDLADQRGMAGLPNLLDTGSNLAFILVAMLGLDYLRTTPDVFHYRFERIPYLAFFLSLAAIGAGSIYYHLAPDNARLFWDRLSMSLGIAAFLAIVIAERWHARVGLRLLAPLMITGASTVVWWRLSASLGSENLVPYLVFQGWAILTALLFLAGVQGRYRHGAYPALAILLYGAALVAERLDQAIFAMGGWLSGHTLKHLLAALAAYQLLRMLRRRAGDTMCDGIAYSRRARDI